MKFDKKYWDKLDEEIPGWQSETEARFLVENAKGPVYVEIGVAYGKSLKLLRHHMPDKDSLCGIDLIDHGIEVPNAFVEIADSRKRYCVYRDESIDTLFIDGDHTQKGVMEDVICWWPKVKKGGTIIFHDYQRDKAHEGVSIIVDAVKPLLDNFRYDRHIAAGEKN